MDIDIFPPNHLPNQEHPPSTLPLRGISASCSFQQRVVAPLTHAPPRGDLPPPTPQINSQSPDKCECATPIDYERYIENGAIPRTKKTYATIYTCTLCNTDFKTKKKFGKTYEKYACCLFSKRKR